MTMRHAVSVTAFAAFLCGAVPAAFAQGSSATVFCVNDRIRVERTTIAQLRVHQPHAPICIIGPSFDFQPDGVTWVRQNLRSDVGGACSCR